MNKRFAFFGIKTLNEMNSLDYPAYSTIVTVVPAPKESVIKTEGNPNWIVIVELYNSDEHGEKDA